MNLPPVPLRSYERLFEIISMLLASMTERLFETVILHIHLAEDGNTGKR